MARDFRPDRKLFAFKLEDTARNFGSDRHTPRIQIGKYCQAFWSSPKNASRLNCLKLPGVLVLTDKRLAFKLENIARNFVLTDKHLAPKLVKTARNFGPNQTTPRVRIGNNRREFRARLRNIARNLGSDRKAPRVQTETYCWEFWF